MDDTLRAHLESLADPGDDFVESMIRAAGEAGIPDISIGHHQAGFLQTALRTIDAREVAEVGTLAGVTALRMARALPVDGRVRTIEPDPERAGFAEHWIARSDVAGKVEVHRGRGSDILGQWADQSLDAIFIDADKQGYATYVREAGRLLRDRGLLFVDNAFAFGHLLDDSVDDPDVQAIRDINAALASHELFDGSLLPLGDGMWFCTRRPR